MYQTLSKLASKTNFVLVHSFSRYFSVGVVAFMLDYLTLNLLYYFVGLSLLFASTAGFFTGFVVSFYTNRFWVFSKSGSKRKAKSQLIEYIALVIFNYIFTIVSLMLLENLGLEPFIAKIFIMILIMLWNYYIFKKFIFAGNK